MRYHQIIFCAILMCCNSGAQQSQTKNQDLFHSQRSVAQLEHRTLEEASGLEESYKNPGHFWSHNDSGGDPSLYLLKPDGSVVLEVSLAGIENRDWEELVTVQLQDQSHIYIAEIGDNRAVHDELQIIRIEEPLLTDTSFISVPLDNLEIMTFQYEEGARDAEAMMFDHTNSELVLVTKREDKALVYSFPFQPGPSTIRISSKGEVPSRLFTAADASKDGEVILKNYNTIFYWPPSTSKSIADRLIEWDVTSIAYQPEPQGEAMCWSGDDFYTLSERSNTDQKLLFFERK